MFNKFRRDKPWPLTYRCLGCSSGPEPLGAVGGERVFECPVAESVPVRRLRTTL
jgi:hypothetical protein